MIGDFLGFTFGDIHSSALGIVRTSNGSRYEMGLLPSLVDKTVQVPGADRTYYFGSNYTQKNFSLPIAFDNITEEQLNEMQYIFGTKKMSRLIFDEAPYKQYMVKSNGIQGLNFICFDEDGQRIYKGEGSLQFIAYEPFATNRIENGESLKFIEQYRALVNDDNYPDIYYYSAPGLSISHTNGQGSLREEVVGDFQWAIGSHMKELQSEVPNTFTPSDISLPIYNAGNRETDYKIYLLGGANNSNPFSKFMYTLETEEGDFTINIEGLENISIPNANNWGIVIDTKTELIQIVSYIVTNGVYKFTNLGTVINQYMTAGTFKKIPAYYEGEISISSNTCNGIIEYNYKYY